MMELQIVYASEIAAIASGPGSPGIHFNGSVIRWSENHMDDWTRYPDIF